MAVTRINNNQITDASAGNAYVGVNAASKVQNYTITSQKIANNLTYGSDLTVTGNFTVQGTTTTVDTVNTLIQDPLITLADGQTTGTPTVDIGTIGLRGSENSAVMAWKESAKEFVTALSNTTVSNTTFTISSYANLHTGNFIAQGTTSLVGNVIGTNTNFTSNITGGNLITPGQVVATANITGGNVLTGGLISATGTITSAANVIGGNITTAGQMSAGANITGGNVLTGGLISATGTITSAANVIGGNITTAGQMSAAGNITGGNLLTPGLISATGNLVTGANLIASGYASVTGNVRGGNINTDGLVSATGNIIGGNLNVTTINTTSISASGNVTGGNLITAGNVNGTSGYFTGNVTVLGNLNATIGVVYANSGIFYGNSVNGNNAVFAGIPGYTPLGSNVVMQLAGNVNNYSQLNFQNINNGNRASTDFIATADNGNDTAYYLDLGINSSTFNDPVNYPGFGPNDSYVHNHGGNLILNPETTGKAINFMVGGTANSNVIGYVNSSGMAMTGIVSASGNVTGGNLITSGLATVTGNITGGNILTGGLISATSTITGANITGANLITAGLITATGNITGGNVNTSQVYGASGLTLVTGSGTITLNPAGNVSMSSKNINNLADPVADQDAATKNYVDTVAQGLDPKASVVYATASALPTYTYNNGTAGVGATITATANGALSIDGSTPTAGDRVLIKNETSTNQPYNGIYVVTTVGSAGAAFVLTRSADFNQAAEIPSAFTFVEFGSTNADTGWVCTTNAPVVMGTTNIVFVQFSGAGSYTANTSAGLSLIGTQFNAKVDNITTAFDGGGNIIVKASANLTTPNIGAATGTSLSTTGNITGGNLLTAGIISTASNIYGGNLFVTSIESVTGNVTVGNLLTSGLISATGNIIGGGLVSTGNVTATSAATATFGDNTVLYSGYTTLNTFGIHHLTGANPQTIQIATNSGVNGIAIGTQGAANSIVYSTGGVNFIVGATLNANTTPSGGTSIAQVTSGGIFTSGLISATGNITGGNFVTAGTVTAATVNAATIGNTGAAVTAATVSAATIGNTGAALQGATASLTANVTGGNLLTGGLISATGNITSGANLIVAGYATITGNVTGGNLITAGLATVTGNVNTSAGVLATGNVTGGNINTPGLATVTGNISGGANLIIAGYETVTGNITGGNLITGGLATVTGNITSAANIQGANVIGGNIVLTGNSINELDAGGTITVNGAGANTNFSVSGRNPNVFFVNGSSNTASFGNATQIVNALVAFNSSTSLVMPVGNTGQRPGTGVTGMLRFNTTVNNLEIFDNSAWATVGTPSFTVIADQQFTGNGVQTQYTLSSTQTTNSCIVSINGIVQIPNTAYSVNGTDPTCVLTFTEAPSAGDLIDVRQITTTTTVSSISNSSGNAVIYANAVAANIDITGNVVASQGLYSSHEIVAGLEGYTNLNTYSANITYPTGTNRLLVGPMTVNSGVTVTVAGTGIVVIL